MTVEIPPGLEWDVWRVVGSERFAVTPAEIWEKWSLSDLLDAHDTLDILEDAATRAAAKSP